MGLPYVSDPAVTRHLNAFLEATGQAPDAILFNGGFFIPQILRERVADVVGRWYGRRPEILENSELDLAVARGAAYYSYVRATGSGILVRGGLPRTYYIGLGEPREGKFPAVCLVPRGAEEGAAVEIDNDALQLVANRPVSFRLYSSLTRQGDRLADVVEFASGDPELHRHAPLNAVIRFGKKAEERLIPVQVGRAPHRDRNAGDVVRIQDQRQPLAPAVRAAQGSRQAAGGAQGRGGGQRAGAWRRRWS